MRFYIWDQIIENKSDSFCNRHGHLRKTPNWKRFCQRKFVWLKYHWNVFVGRNNHQIKWWQRSLRHQSLTPMRRKRHCEFPQRKSHLRFRIHVYIQSVTIWYNSHNMTMAGCRTTTDVLQATLIRQMCGIEGEKSRLRLTHVERHRLYSLSQFGVY